MAENIPIRRKRAAALPAVPQAITIPEPPAHLSEYAGAWWRKVNSEWVLGPDSLPLLQAACECWDSYQKYRAHSLANPTIETKSGMVRANPAERMANDALREFRMCLRQLGLQPPEK